MPSNLPTPNRLSPGLYVVATPIGNLADITLRALDVLARADVIAAEDTRHSRRLLAAHHITNQLVAYHEHNEIRRAPELIERLDQGGAVALITDAGTPMVSDPGYRLVQAAAQRRIQIIPIPGASAAVAAMSVSGLPTDQFTFIGFPARKKAKRMAQLRMLAQVPHPLIFYQSPQRLTLFIQELMEACGDRRAVLGREMTKQYEEFVRGPLSHIQAQLGQRKSIKGECTLIVDGAPAAPANDSATNEELLELAISEALAAGGSVNDIAKALAERFDLNKPLIYRKVLAMKASRRQR
ncbi:MAG: 16S rRNA (cytidine(1402)-2'-O)-methyltransferase [Desulfatitalea sp.]|nr:16S rRNA (cytidine(1402)-2'-O)-methyltransferase [Desulfatitalea sp.]NNJ99551.1 16S rRNA (cytidine(1402)-2'-O)-methyltransferase [Desulfatitalea sp.]